jgi:CPA2 family monovalent cation:H+ antiporter-2
LRGYFHGLGDVADDDEHLQVRLHSVPLNDKASAIGLPLSALNIEALEAEITAVRRGKSRIPFAPDTVLEAGDVVVLRGTATALERAEKRLLEK